MNSVGKSLCVVVVALHGAAIALGDGQMGSVGLEQRRGDR